MSTVDGRDWGRDQPRGSGCLSSRGRGAAASRCGVQLAADGSGTRHAMCPCCGIASRCEVRNASRLSPFPRRISQKAKRWNSRRIFIHIAISDDADHPQRCLARWRCRPSTMACPRRTCRSCSHRSRCARDVRARCRCFASEPPRLPFARGRQRSSQQMMPFQSQTTHGCRPECLHGGCC